MSGLQIFNYNNQKVRTVEKDGELWFVAADVCAVLEIANVTDAIKRLDEYEYTLVSIEGASNGLAVNAVNESGLYELVLGSRKPEAKEFKRWIKTEVLPSIRKTGSYSKQLSPAELQLEQAKLMVAFEKRLDSTENTVKQLSETLTEEPQGDWQSTMSNEVRKIVNKFGLDFGNEFRAIYDILESKAGVDLKSRVIRKQARVKSTGAKAEQINAITKLHIIAEDIKLRAIFESILKSRKIKHLSEGRDLTAYSN